MLGGESWYLCSDSLLLKGMGMPASCLPLARTAEFLGMANPSQEEPLGTCEWLISFCHCGHFLSLLFLSSGLLGLKMAGVK